MKPPFQLIADNINRRPAAVAAFFILVLLIALYGVGLITMQTGSETYLDKSTPRGALLDKYMDTFGSDAVMLLVEADDILDPDVLAYLARLQAEIGSERYVVQTSSIINLIEGANGGALPASAAEIDRLKEQLPADLVARYIPSRMMTIGIVTLEPGVSQDGKHRLLENIESRIRLSDAPPGVQVTVTGDAAFEKQMREEIGSSMGVLIGAAMILMLLAVALLFAHVRYRFLPVLVVATGLIMTFGIMGLARIPISMVAIGAFPILIGIGIDYAIQFQSRFDEEVRASPIHQAVTTTVVRSGPAVLYAMAATSLGFIAMWVSPIPMIRDFGLICVIGVVCCYCAALVIIPTFGTLINYRPKAAVGQSDGSRMEVYDRFLGNVAGTIAKNPMPAILVLGLVAIAGVQIDASIPINADEETFVPSDMPSIIDLNKVRRTMGSTETLPIFICGDGVTDLDVLTWMDEFQEYEVTHNDKITSAASIVTYIKQYNGGVLPSTDREVASVLERIPEETRESYISGNTEAVIEFGLVDMENEVALSLVDRVRSDITWQHPPAGITATPTGMLEMFANLMNDISRSKTTMTALGFGLILLFLIAIYRKLTAVSPIIPIAFIVGWNGAIMYLLGIDYTPLTATLGSMTIGVASEYTILIMERYQEERACGREMVEAIRQSVQKIGTAITVSGMTTVFGFSALLLSTFNIVKNFGAVTVITIGLSLCGAILVMPAVLSLMEQASGMAPAAPLPE